MIKKLSLIIILGLVTTGCSVTQVATNPKYEWLTGSKAAYGDREGDVCYTCGEDFIFIPNEELGFLKKSDKEKYNY